MVEIHDTWNAPVVQTDMERQGRSIPRMGTQTYGQERPETVNHPKHYCRGRIEVIEFIEDQNFDFHMGSAVKYICRSLYTGKAVEDLEKAKWFIERKIALLKGAGL